MPAFFTSGGQLGEKDERNLFPAAIDIIDQIHPRAVMIENVRGFLDAVFEDYRTCIAGTLRKLGYTTDWRLLNASDFGVPQLRPRVAFIAILNPYAEHFAWPQPRPFAPETVGEALYDLISSRGWRGAKLWKKRANEIAPTIVGGSKKHGGPDLGPTRSKRAWAALANSKRVLYSMPRLRIPSPTGGQSGLLCAITVKRRQELRREGKEDEAPPLNALDYLLAVDDLSRVGALRFRDENNVFQRVHEEGRRIPPLIELGHLLSASRALEANRETAADLAYLRGRGTFLGGMRPKCTVVDEDSALSIGKFPSITDERAVTKGEVLALTLAKQAGINAAAARIAMSEHLPVALIRRFDRRGLGERIMYISAATMLGVEATEPDIHMYTEIVDAIRVHGSEVQTDIEELWRRIAFSILITNTDDHLHNHASCMKTGNSRGCRLP